MEAAQDEMSRSGELHSVGQKWSECENAAPQKENNKYGTLDKPDYKYVSSGSGGAG